MTAPAPNGSYDELIRRLAVVLGIAAIAGVSVWMMAPFLLAILWAGTIAVATWPLLLRVQALLAGRRWAATTVLTLLLAVGFFIPLLMVTGTIVEHAGDAADPGARHRGERPAPGARLGGADSRGRSPARG